MDFDIFGDGGDRVIPHQAWGSDASTVNRFGIDVGPVKNVLYAPLRGAYTGVQGAALTASTLFPWGNENDPQAWVAQRREHWLPRKEDFFALADEIEQKKQMLTPDPGTVGLASQIIGGIAQLPGMLAVGGAAGAAIFPALATGQEMVDAGLSGKAAAIVGATTGLTNAAMMAIPGAGETLKGTLGLMAANPVLGMATRYATQKGLEGAGYPEQAKNFDPLDPAAMGTDLAFSLLFGGLGYRGAKLTREAKTEVAKYSDRWQELQDVLPVEVVDSAHVMGSWLKALESNPHNEVVKGAVEIHLNAMDKALADMQAGKPVDIAREIKSLFGPDYATPTAERFKGMLGEVWGLDEEHTDVVMAMTNAFARYKGEHLDDYINRTFAGGENREPVGNAVLHQDGQKETLSNNFKQWFGDWEARTRLQQGTKFIDDALNHQGTGFFKLTGLLADPKGEVSAALGAPVSEHELNANDLRHMIGSHGDATIEAGRNQIPVDENDIRLVPYIITNYDRVKTGSTDPKGRKSVIFEKRVNGTVYYVEAQTQLPGIISSKTMYIKPSLSVNAAKGTPHNTSLTAQSRGHKNSVTQLLDEINSMASAVTDADGKPLIVFHGAPDVRGIFAEGFQAGSRGKVWFAAKDRSTANTYADDHRALDFQNAEPGTIPLYLSLKNPMMIDAKGGLWRDTQHYVAEAKDQGYDGIIIENVRDDYNNSSRTKPTTVYAWFDEGQAKSALDGPMMSRIDGKPIPETGPNRGTWDGTDPNVMHQGERGAVSFLNDGRAVLHALKNPDISTVMHELAHVWRRQLDPEDMTVVAEFYADSRGRWDRAAEEKFARAFEKYLGDGKAPSEELKGVFEKFKTWLVDIYRGIIGSPLEAQVPNRIRDVFDKMLTREQTPEEVTYHEIAKEVLAEEAAKGGDSEWQKRKAAERSAEVTGADTVGAIHESPLQPDRPANDWFPEDTGDAPDLTPSSQRLTKAKELNPETDTLMQAITKLGGIDKAQALKEWGESLVQVKASGDYGKVISNPIFKTKNGKSIERITEALAEAGFLPRDEHGKPLVGALEDALSRTAAGETIFSHQVIDREMERRIALAEAAQARRQGPSQEVTDAEYAALAARMSVEDAADPLTKRIDHILAEKGDIPVYTETTADNQTRNVTAREALDRARLEIENIRDTKDAYDVAAACLYL